VAANILLTCCRTASLVNWSNATAAHSEFVTQLESFGACQSPVLLTTTSLLLCAVWSWWKQLQLAALSRRVAVASSSSQCKSPGGAWPTADLHRRRRRHKTRATWRQLQRRTVVSRATPPPCSVASSLPTLNATLPRLRQTTEGGTRIYIRTTSTGRTCGTKVKGSKDHYAGF